MDNTSVFMGEKLLQIEAKSGLFDSIVCGICLWQYVRYHCLLKILEEISGIEMSCKSNVLIQDKSKIFAIDELIKKRQFWVRKKDLLVINHPRRVKEGNYYKCVITDTILENLDYSYYVYEKEYQGIHLKPVKTKHLKYISMKVIEKSKKCDEQKYNRLLKQFSVNVIQTFEEECGIKFSKELRNHIVSHIKGTFYNILYYKIWAYRVLTLVKPKVVIVTVGYDPFVQVLVAEAKKLNIPTVELEHGRIGDTHLAYNYVYKGDIETFADYMFVYGEYEKMIPRYPIDRKNVIAVGYPELEKKACLYTKKKRNQKVLIFISGVLDGRIVSKYAIKLRKSTKLKNVRMIYKLHPAEYGQWEQLYPDLVDSGLEIVSKNTHDIYYYIGNSDYVVGISSTVLFEATMFCTNIFIIQERDYRKAEVLYQNNLAELIKDENELIDKIAENSLKNQQVDNDKLFKKNSIENVKTELKKIIAVQQGKVEEL